MCCPKIKLHVFFSARKAVDELWEVVLDLPILPPTSPSAGHRQGCLVLAPTQAVAVIVVVAVENAVVSPVAAVVIAVPTDPPLLLSRLLLLQLLPTMSHRHRRRRCVVICRQLQPGHVNGGMGQGGGGAPPSIIDATAPSAAVVDARRSGSLRRGRRNRWRLDDRCHRRNCCYEHFLWRACGRRQFAAKRRKTPQNTAKHRKKTQKTAKYRKYRELAINLRGTKYLGGINPPPPFSSVEINRGPKWGGQGPLFPLKTFFLASSIASFL